jgi:hypothetical protein
VENGSKERVDEGSTTSKRRKELEVENATLEQIVADQTLSQSRRSVPQKRRKRQRLGVSTVPGERPGPWRPDHVWAIAFFGAIRPAMGTTSRLRRVVDEFIREAMTASARRGWCRFCGAGSAYIEPGSPWQTPDVESLRLLDP